MHFHSSRQPSIEPLRKLFPQAMGALTAKGSGKPQNNADLSAVGSENSF